MADITRITDGAAVRRGRAAALAPAADATVEVAAEPAGAGGDLAAPHLLLNRELSWLSFDGRVLHEAQDAATPLLERVKFLSISASNLDEFFMKRIGGLKQQVGAGVQERTVDGRTPQEQINECNAVVREIERQQRAVLERLLAELRQHGI